MIEEKLYCELSYKEKLLLNFQEYSDLYHFYLWLWKKTGVKIKNER